MDLFEEELKCQYCGKRDDTVVLCNDPFTLEIEGEEVEICVCPDCYEERLYDI